MKPYVSLCVVALAAVLGANGCDSTSAQTTIDPFPASMEQLPLRDIGVLGRLPTGDILLVGFTNEFGYELYVTDGTADGTELVVDLNPGPDSAVFSGAPFALFNDGCYFIGITPETGKELWFTDGTAEGTVLIADSSAGPVDSLIRGMAVNSDELLVSVTVADEIHSFLTTELIIIPNRTSH